MDVQFRQAAGEGNIVLMRQLAPSVDPMEADPSTKQTAAHRAAEKGHAAVLQYLFGLGDTFEKKDREGKTAEQLANNSACIEVFELVRLAGETNRFVDKVFPNRVDVEAVVDPNFVPFREATEICANRMANEKVGELWKVVKEECMAAPEPLKKEIYAQWRHQCSLLSYFYLSYITLLVWKGETVRSGACAETTSVGFAYLNYVKKSRYSVEWVQVEENNNHAFIILNGSLVIDLFYRKSFFCAHQDIELKSSSIKNPPQSLWPQEKSVALFNKLHSRLEEDCKKLLNSF